jgi:hypothetical protein
MALTDNLVAYWKLDGNSNDSVGSNNGTDTAVSYNASYGKIGQGVYFNGSSTEQIIIAANSSLDIATGPFSISLWVYFLALPTNTYQMWLFWKGSIDGSSPGYCLNLYNNGGIYQLNMPKFGIANQLYNWTPSINTWYHIVGVQNYSGTPTTVTFYINGSALGSTSSNTSAYGNTAGFSAYIGGHSSLSSTPPTNAYIDEIGVWSRGLTSTEVTQLYNSGAGLQLSTTANTNRGFFTFFTNE